jgi:Tol biopolymer transport system component
MAGQAYHADPREARLLELRRVTFDGKSSHPRWHPDSRHLLFERGEPGCGELVKMDLRSGETTRLSPTAGGSSLGGYLDEPRRLAFVHSDSPEPPCRPSFADGAPRWRPPDADVWVKGPHAEPAQALLPSPAAEGELATGAQGHLVFTSLRDGDPELYLARDDGTDLRRITRAPGYDGGATLSPDGTRLVWQSERAGSDQGALTVTPPDSASNTDGDSKNADGRASDTSEEAYQDDAAPRGDEPIAPEQLHLRLAGIAGQHERALGALGRYDVEPSFLPDSQRLLFSSDYDSPPKTPPTFDIYLVNVDGPTTVTGTPAVERVTYHRAYDGQAVVSPDGRWIAFASSRATVDEGPGPQGRTDIFVARWRDVD